MTFPNHFRAASLAAAVLLGAAAAAQAAVSLPSYNVDKAGTMISRFEISACSVKKARETS